MVSGFWGGSGVVLGLFWGVLGCFWGVFGVFLGWFWGGFKVVLGVFLGCFWVVLGSFGVVLGWFWGSIRVVFRWFWDGFRVDLGWFIWQVLGFVFGLFLVLGCLCWGGSGVVLGCGAFFLARSPTRFSILKITGTRQKGLNLNES